MLKTLETIATFKSTSGALTQNLEQDSLGWKRWYSEEKAEIADLPRSFRDITPFYRLPKFKTKEFNWRRKESVDALLIAKYHSLEVLL